MFDINEVVPYKRQLTRSQYNQSQRNRNRLWKQLIGKIDSKGLVLHHRDTELLYREPERYIQWLPEDLEIVTKAEHMRIHKTGTHHSDETKLKMRLAKLGKPKSEITKLRMSEAHRKYWINKKARETLDKLKTE